MAATGGAAAGLAGILASHRAPAHAQGTTLHILRWNDFVPAGDEVLARQMTEASRILGAKVTLERINANDIQARVTAAVSSGAGPDIIHMLHNWAHLYEKSLVDVSDIAQAIGQAQGGYYPAAGSLQGRGNVARRPPRDHAKSRRLSQVASRRNRCLGISE